MDYIVAGFGIGAVLALVGFALWEFFGDNQEPGKNWLTRTAIGFMIGALVLWAVTAVTLVSTIDDATGSRLVLLTTLAILLAIAAGAFWYWHSAPHPVELAASAQAPAPSNRSPVTPVASVVELDEWDSWPERLPVVSEPSVGAPEPLALESFEPEVAAEPVDQGGRSYATVEWAGPDSVEAVPHVDFAAVDAVADELVDGPDSEPEPAQVTETAPASSKVRAFRKRPIVAPAQPLIQESAPEAPVVELPEETAGPPGAPETEELVVAVEMAPALDTAANGAVAAEAFESALLADIDGTSVESDGGFNSPLLSDLGSNPDELEGVGLARWRPEARLTAEDSEAPRQTPGSKEPRSPR